MHSDTLTTLFRHHVWANLQILDACRSLTDAQLVFHIPGTYGGIGDTLQHLVGAEQNYVARITTGQRFERPDDAPALSFAEMRAVLERNGDGLITWASQVRAEDVVSIDWDGTMVEVPKTILLTQVINHATEHRAQIMALLTQLGIEPPNVDAWSYFEQGR